MVWNATSCPAIAIPRVSSSDPGICLALSMLPLEVSATEGRSHTGQPFG